MQINVWNISRNIIKHTSFAVCKNIFGVDIYVNFLSQCCTPTDKQWENIYPSNVILNIFY